MQIPLCSRCKKNVAVIFVTRMENGKTTNEGICLKCAKELNIKPVADMMERMGVTEEDLDNMSKQMEDTDPQEFFGGMMQQLMEAGVDGMPQSMLDGSGAEEADDDEDDASDESEDNQSRTPVLPFFNKPKAENGAKSDKKQAKEDKKKKFLNLYGTNLTRKAADGKLDAVIGRESETERVIQILNRRQKNNPCLIGEPGVGKTAVAEGLAQKITSGNVPYKLQDKEVWLLDMTSMVAGTQFRGQFESRMKGLIDEVKLLGNIILVIDEVHNLVGAGDAEGSMNAANILKPSLSRGEIQVIGATTFKEYRKHIEKDAALERRFQPVTINEPTIEQTVEIIKGIRPYYEKFHGVKISDEAARQAVYLSERYISDRFLPDKAIDLVDEACSDINLKNAEINEAARLENEKKQLSQEHETLSADDDEAGTYQRLAYIKSRQLQVNARLAELAEKPAPQMSVEDLARVIEMWTKIPASKVQQQEFERLIKLAERLKARIIGQDDAVDSVAAAIQRHRAGVSPKRKPVSFVFVGPTGVGKTELVKCLAADLFDTPDALVRLDMSEYMEKHSVSKLIGSPPGYVGYDEAGQLTEKLRRRPYCVVLFDEIEKAHADVLNVLLQILDDGVATDAQGRKVSFENAIIVMTSNAGSERAGGAVGFGRGESQQSRDKAQAALSEIMRPEFINRIDEIVAFNQLSQQDFAKISRIMLGELVDALAKNDINLTFDENVIDFLVKMSYSIKYGARNLRRFIQKQIEDKAAGIIIAAYKSPVSQIHVSVNGDNIELVSK